MKCFSFEVQVALDTMAADRLKDNACSISWNAFLQSRRRSLVFVHMLEADRIKGCVLLHSIINQEGEPMAQAQFLLDSLGIGRSADCLTGISEEEAYPLIIKAFRCGYLQDVDEVLSAYGVLRMPGILGEVRRLSINSSQIVLQRKAQQFPQVPELEKEICRIFNSAAVTPHMGHPVHYLLEMARHQRPDEAVDALLAGLYQNRRIQRRQYLVLHLERGRMPEEDELVQDAVEASIGGALVIDFIKKCPAEDPDIYPNLFDIPDVCFQMKKHAKDVLFIFCFPKFGKKERESFEEMLPDMPFLLMTQDKLKGVKAKEYLDEIAGREGTVPDDMLYHSLEKESEGFLESELQAQYNSWYGGYLRRVAYPQYAEVQCFGHRESKMASAEPVHCKELTAYDKLQSFVGLANAKNAMDRMLSAHRARKLYSQHGIKADMHPMHMVFTGNPGTAKTTVARMYARILREEGILRKGELIEVSRADLVGKYVGWTARLVKDHIRKAKGSVLFIDEAYSLLNGKEGQFGEEAINTLVMEMENCREDTLIILAGYPGPMEELLRFNPGLRSRIGFHISFEDYSSSEMLQILRLMAQEHGFVLDEGVGQRLLPFLEQAALAVESGNGRFVRNMLDIARMKQAERLLRMSPDELTVDSVKTLLPQDFEQPTMGRQTQTLIGFQQ